MMQNESFISIYMVLIFKPFSKIKVEYKIFVSYHALT